MVAKGVFTNVKIEKSLSYQIGLEKFGWNSWSLTFFFPVYFYGLKLLYANVQCVYIVYAKYQMASVKADFHIMQYLSTNKTLIKMQSVKKMAKFKML